MNQDLKPQAPIGQIFVLGETLCDLFAPVGVVAEDASTLTPHTGGAVANVARRLARAGHPVSLITATGIDPFGERCRNTLEADGVDLSFATRLPLNTGIVFVQRDEAGERTFKPMRRHAADEAIATSQLPDFAGATLFHIGTVSLRPGHSAREATRVALENAHAAGVPISVDVNLRARMFSDDQSLKDAAIFALEKSQIIKCTALEARFLFGKSTPETLFQHLPNATLLCITDDEHPAQLATRKRVCEHAPTSTAVVDATGAGDAFFAVVLDAFIRSKCDVSALELEVLLARACAAGTKACTHEGALER